MKEIGRCLPAQYSYIHTIYTVNSFGNACAKLFVEEKTYDTNKNIDGFYTKTIQKGGFSKLCVKI